MVSNAAEEGPLVVAPGLFCSWHEGQVRIGSVDDPFLEFAATAGVLLLLSLFSAPRLRADAHKRLLEMGVPAPEQAVDRMTRLKLLVPAAEAGQSDTQALSAYDVVRHLGTTHDIDAVSPEFVGLFADVEPFTLTSKAMGFALYQAINYVVANDIPGAIVECGVARGGSMMLAAATLQARGRCDRDIFLFDTFDWSWENASERDGFVGTPDRLDGLPNTPGTKDERARHGVGFEAVTANMAGTGYPADRIRLVQGMVQDTLAAAPIGDIAVLRLDTDFYESTLVELEILYPRLVPGGVLILDDYGKLKGATAAVDEYFARHPDQPLLHRVETQGRIGTKPAPCPRTPYPVK